MSNNITGSTHPWWREKHPKALWPVYENFKVFLAVTWKHLNLPNPTYVQYDIADYLQHGPRRSIVEAFRGVGKSWITSAFVCWCLLRNAQMNILVVSASKGRADDFSTFTLRLIHEMPILMHLIPRNDQRQSKISFDVALAEPDHAPSVKSVGITGQIAGSRAHLIVPDDIEVPNNSATQTMREKLRDSVKEFDAVLHPGGTIRYLGTPQCEDSLYNVLPQRGYEVRIWPSQYPAPDEVHRYGDRLAPILTDMIASAPEIAHQPTDPARFNSIDLREREASYGRSGYALQFMLDTSLSDANKFPLRVRDLIVTTLDDELAAEKVMWANDKSLLIEDIPTVSFDGDKFHRPLDYKRDGMGNVLRRPYQGAVLAIDPAGRGKDETTACVVRMLNSQLFVPKMGAWREGYTPETLTAIAEMARDNKVKEIVIESNFGDGMFTQLLTPYLQRIYPCTVSEVRHSVQKEKRIIDTLEPVMNQHRLIFDPSVLQWDYDSVDGLGLSAEERQGYRLVYQMTRLTKERGALTHDDRIDVLSIAVNYWTEQMGADIDKQIAHHNAEALDIELRKMHEYHNNRLGHNGGPSAANWMSER